MAAFGCNCGGAVSVLAEGVGFEPTLRFPVNTLSKRAPSATRPPLLIGPAIGPRLSTSNAQRALSRLITRRPSELIERRAPILAHAVPLGLAFADGGRLSRCRRRRGL